MSSEPTKGLFDETIVDGAPTKFRSPEHKAAWEAQRDESQRAAKMYPAMKQVMERDASRSPSNPYPKMRQQKEADENERRAKFDITMQTQEGVEIRQAARDQIDQLMREARAFPTHRDRIADQIAEVERRFDHPNGNWLEEM